MRSSSPKAAVSMRFSVAQAGTVQQSLGSPTRAHCNVDRPGKTAPVFHPEFGRFMLEATPGRPWGIDLKDLLDVEQDMKWRYTGSTSAAITNMKRLTALIDVQLRKSTWSPANFPLP